MKDKFANAFRGVKYAFLDHSVRLQMVLALCAVCAGVILKLESMEWAAVIICIGGVLTAEILNTCIEKVCDMYDSHPNEKIAVIKDLGAGAVLCMSLAALITALIILFRHIF